MTVKLKLGRAWVFHFAGVRFALGFAVPLFAWFGQHWLLHWGARVALILLVLISIEFVSFKRRADGTIRYWKYVAFIPAYWADLPTFPELSYETEQAWELTWHRIWVQPHSAFACDKPENVIAWLREQLLPLPEAIALDAKRKDFEP